MSNFATYNGCFQKPSRFPQGMLKPRQVLFGIILLLGISFSPYVTHDLLATESGTESNWRASVAKTDESISKYNNIL